MDKNINYTLVGAFMIVLISAIVLAIIWLSSGLSLTHFKTYIIYMQESVSGLSIDSPIEFNGVDVGTVSDIELDALNPKRVKVELNIHSSTPVTQGTVATLNTRGFTGITYVALKDVSLDLRPLVTPKGELYPVIKTGPSLFLRIDTALQQLSSNLHDVTQSIQLVLDKENQLAIKKILNNMQSITATWASNDNQILPMAYRALSNFNEASRNLAGVSAELQQNPSMLIRGKTAAPLGPGETR
ncbi:MAG: hypothetical protein A3F43_05765 [Gammaproteobacteria bacterium RIFCSPHIGHO2_12_FULL_42_10]|nr:MAG: hypothetical protein A3F43_05765 [Gammaproteobacteria bacterium RIFCSPHIGHO2_12_FULL_42_10]